MIIFVMVTIEDTAKVVVAVVIITNNIVIIDMAIFMYLGPHHYHRRRMELEDMAKVVASVWVAKFVHFIAALTVLPQFIRKKRLNSSYSSKSTEAKQLARQGTEQFLPPKQT